MDNRRIAGIAALILGVVLLFLAYLATTSPVGDPSEAIEGSDLTTGTFWRLGLGVLSLVAGAVLLSRPRLTP